MNECYLIQMVYFIFLRFTGPEHSAHTSKKLMNYQIIHSIEIHGKMSNGKVKQFDMWLLNTVLWSSFSQSSHMLFLYLSFRIQILTHS